MTSRILEFKRNLRFCFIKREHESIQIFNPKNALYIHGRCVRICSNLYVQIENGFFWIRSSIRTLLYLRKNEFLSHIRSIYLHFSVDILYTTDHLRFVYNNSCIFTGRKRDKSLTRVIVRFADLKGSALACFN